MRRPNWFHLTYYVIRNVGFGPFPHICEKGYVRSDPTHEKRHIIMIRVELTSLVVTGVFVKVLKFILVWKSKFYDKLQELSSFEAVLQSRGTFFLREYSFICKIHEHTYFQNYVEFFMCCEKPKKFELFVFFSIKNATISWKRHFLLECRPESTNFWLSRGQ